MTVQIVEIAGQKMAMLPIADYERLLAFAEDRADGQAAISADQRRNDGEEYLPAELVDRLMSGESPLKTWRTYRGMTQLELSKKVGLSNLTISRLESGAQETSNRNMRALADALRVTVDDIMPFD